MLNIQENRSHDKDNIDEMISALILVKKISRYSICRMVHQSFIHDGSYMLCGIFFELFYSISE